MGCLSRFFRSFKSDNHKAAEKILKEYSPYDRAHLQLDPLMEERHTSVFRVHDPKYPARDFIAKVSPLSDALNDYYAMKVIREANSEIPSPITIIDSVLLTPKKDEVSLITKVVQKNTLAEGRPLVEILSDPSVSTERKRILYKKFKDWTTEMDSALKEQNFDVEIRKPDLNFFQKHQRLAQETPGFLKSQPDLILATKPWMALVEGVHYDQRMWMGLQRMSRGQLSTLVNTFEDIRIILKSDNVIVGANDQLILFDPF